MGKRIIIVALFGLLFSGFISLSPPTSQTALAAGKCANEPAILGTIKPWYSGLCKEVGGKPETSNEVEVTSVPNFARDLLLNLLSIALQIGGYIAVGFVIWGGMKYIIAAGDAGKLAKAKTIIQNALIGLLIVLASVAIVTFIQGLF